MKDTNSVQSQIDKYASIEFEKKVSSAVLANLGEATQTSPIVAGGAPRDWYLKKTCRDIDIYCKYPSEEAAMDFILGTVMATAKEFYDEVSEPKKINADVVTIMSYESTNPHLQAVYEIEAVTEVNHAITFRKTFQVIFTDVDNQLHNLDYFGCSLSKAYLPAGYTDPVYTKDFVRSIEARTVLYNTYVSDAYLTKIFQRFHKNFNFLRYESDQGRQLLNT